MKSILIFGGSFDPIHNGHLQTALFIQNTFQFQRFIFLPCKSPLLKQQTVATAQQRLEMLRLAVGEYPDTPFEVDPREINRESPSYMVATLKDYRQELGQAVSITILLGQDAFLNLPMWYEWPQLLVLANILIMKRPGFNQALPAELMTLLKEHERYKASELHDHSHGIIYQLNAGEFFVSSTDIRLQIHEEKDSDDLPGSVLSYIKRQDLYI